jgi:hypothetical protein
MGRERVRDQAGSRTSREAPSALNGGMARPSDPYRSRGADFVHRQIFLAGKLICQRGRGISGDVENNTPVHDFT